MFASRLFFSFVAVLIFFPLGFCLSSLLSLLSSLFFSLLFDQSKPDDEDSILTKRRGGRQEFSRQDCESIARGLQHYNQLPASCLKFQEVALDLRRRDSDTTHGSQVLS